MINIIFEKMEQGKTQKQIAIELGITQPAVSVAIKRYFSNIKFCPHCNKAITKDQLLTKRNK